MPNTSNEEIIRYVLLQKFTENQSVFNEQIHDLLNDARKWVEEALLFKYPTRIVRPDPTKWSTEKNHTWDSIINCNVQLNKETIECLLSIQSIDFWVFYLQMRSLENSIQSASELAKFKEFLTAYSVEKFPSHELDTLQKYSNIIFSKVKEEDIIHQLKAREIKLYLIERLDSDKLQINLLNILLYSLIFDLNYTEVTTICVYICYLFAFIEFGYDTDKRSSQMSTIRHWNKNGNWGKVINYYLLLAINENAPIIQKFNLKKCLLHLIDERDIKIYPFQFHMKNIDTLETFKNEKMRTLLNELRQQINSEELIILK